MTNVDTSIHDRTTGLAASFAASHSSPAQSYSTILASPQYLTLYGGWFCPFVQRVWLVLHEKKIPHQYIEINPYKKEKHFLKLNPRGLIPTLAISETNPDKIRAAEGETNGVNSASNQNAHVEKEKVLYESSVIADYLDAVYSPPPDSSPVSSSPENHSLYPSDPYLRAKHKLWIDHISTRIIPSFYRFLQHTPSATYTLSSAREEFARHLHTLFAEVDYISPAAPFIHGDNVGMADIMLIPWACRVFLLQHYKDGTGIPGPDEGGEDEEGWGRWRVWFKAVAERESVRHTLSERERYVDVYKRYAEDVTGSQVGQATRGGRGLP